MTMDKHARTSRPVVTPYKKVNKPPVSAAERERNKNSLKRYNVYGGGNDAS